MEISTALISILFFSGINLNSSDFIFSNAKLSTLKSTGFNSIRILSEVTSISWY